MKPIRIAFIVSTLDVGGAENVLYEIVTRLDGERFESRLFTLGEAGVVGTRLRESGHAVESGFERGRRDPSVMLRLLPALRRFRPDIVFTLDHHNAIFWGAVLGPRAGARRRIVASHTTGRAGGDSFSRLDRLWMGKGTEVVALSESHARYLSGEGIPRERITVIANGIDVTRFARVDRAQVEKERAALGLAPGTPVVTMVAVLRPEKAHEALLDAARGLVAAHPSLRVLVVGDGPRRAHLQAYAAERGLDGCVTFLGERRDVPVVLALSTVAVLPSRGVVETLPLAVLEAMAAGVPVVASAVGSLPEVISDGDNGRLIAPADADGLRRAVDGIINNEVTATSLAERARATVRERFTVERMVSAYASLFEHSSA